MVPCRMLRLVAYILFFAGIILCVDSLVALADIDREEQTHNTRLVLAGSALASISLFLLAAMKLLKRPASRLTDIQKPPPHLPELDSLFRVLKCHPHSMRLHLTHFYEARRIRCRAARARLKSKINQLFESSPTSPDDHPAG